MSKAYMRVHAIMMSHALDHFPITTNQLADLAQVSVPTAKKHVSAMVKLGLVLSQTERVTFKHNPWNNDPGMLAGSYNRSPVCEVWSSIG